MAVWSEVTPSGEPDGALLSAMPAEWASSSSVRSGFAAPASPCLALQASLGPRTRGLTLCQEHLPALRTLPTLPVAIPVDPPGSPRTPDPTTVRICLELRRREQWQLTVLPQLPGLGL